VKGEGGIDAENGDKEKLYLLYCNAAIKTKHG